MMNDRYGEFKQKEEDAQIGLVVGAVAVGGVAALVSVVTVARMAVNPFSPLNLLRGPVALGTAGVAALSVVAATKIHDCGKGNPPCP